MQFRCKCHSIQSFEIVFDNNIRLCGNAKITVSNYTCKITLVFAFLQKSRKNTFHSNSPDWKVFCRCTLPAWEGVFAPKWVPRHWPQQRNKPWWSWFLFRSLYLCFLSWINSSQKWLSCCPESWKARLYGCLLYGRKAVYDMWLLCQPLGSSKEPTQPTMKTCNFFGKRVLFLKFLKRGQYIQFKRKNNENDPYSELQTLPNHFDVSDAENKTYHINQRKTYIVVHCLSLACRHASALNLLEIFVRKHGWIMDNVNQGDSKVKKLRFDPFTLRKFSAVRNYFRSAEISRRGRGACGNLLRYLWTIKTFIFNTEAFLLIVSDLSLINSIPLSAIFLGRVTDRWGSAFSPVIWPAQVCHIIGALFTAQDTHCPSSVTLPKNMALDCKRFG